MQIEAQDYGYVAYLMLKYDAIIKNIKIEKIDNTELVFITVEVKKDINEIKVFEEYEKSDFRVYNSFLKYILKEVNKVKKGLK